MENYKIQKAGCRDRGPILNHLVALTLLMLHAWCNDMMQRTTAACCNVCNRNTVTCCNICNRNTVTCCNICNRNTVTCCNICNRNTVTCCNVCNRNTGTCCNIRMQQRRRCLQCVAKKPRQPGVNDGTSIATKDQVIRDFPWIVEQGDVYISRASGKSSIGGSSSSSSSKDIRDRSRRAAAAAATTSSTTTTAITPCTARRGIQRSAFIVPGPRF